MMHGGHIETEKTKGAPKGAPAGDLIRPQQQLPQPQFPPQPQLFSPQPPQPQP